MLPAPGQLVTDIESLKIYINKSEKYESKSIEQDEFDGSYTDVFNDVVKDYVGPADAYRIKVISEVQRQLELETQNRELLSKNYNKSSILLDVIGTITAGASMGSSVITTSELTTVVISPAVIAIQRGSIAAGAIYLVTSRLSKEFSSKKNDLYACKFSIVLDF